MKSTQLAARPRIDAFSAKRKSLEDTSTSVNFGEYVVFVDESGDANLDPIDPRFPMLNLVFCIIRKDHYFDHVTPKLKQLKEEFFGHADLILHESDMRRKTGVFSILRDSNTHKRWMVQLLRWIDDSNVSVISACIDKIALTRRYAHPFDPYDLAIRFCLERTRQFLAVNNQIGRPTQVIFESRGKKHDQAAQLEFQQILTQANPLGHHLPDFTHYPLESLFIPKKANLAGHQLCDLLARPLAKWSFNPDSHQRPMQIIRPKLIAHKVFPQTGWRRPNRSGYSNHFKGYTRFNPSANDSQAPR